MQKHSLRTKCVTLAIRVLSIFMLFRLVTLAGMELALKSGRPENIRAALRFVPDESEAYYKLAVISERGKGPAGEARGLYRQALRENPLNHQALFNLASDYLLAGRRAEALECMREFSRLNPGNPEKLWDQAVFLLAAGEPGEAMERFSRSMQLDKTMEPKVFETARKVGVPVRYLAAVALRGEPDATSRYLDYLRKKRDLGGALALWNSVKHEDISEDSRLYLCQFLMDNKKYPEAMDLWREILKTDVENGLYSTEFISNGGFEKDILNGCFDWQYRARPGVAVGYDTEVRAEGKRSMHITFDGNHNPSFELKQVVMLRPGTYVFRAELKTSELTTNGVHLLVRGKDCPGTESSEPITGSTPWQTVEVKFSVPPGCGVVEAALVRDASSKFNNLVGGDVWVDAVELKEDHFPSLAGKGAPPGAHD